MRKRKTSTTPTVPLPERIRAALAQGWHTLAALDDLTGLRGSKARAAVHEALREIKASGAVIEESMALGGVAVRIVMLPAPKPDDGSGEWEPASHEEGDGAAWSDGIPALSPAAAEVMADLIEHPPEPTEGLRALYGTPCAATSTAPDGGPVTCQLTGPHAQHEADFTGPMGKVGDLVHRWDDAPTAERKQCPSVWRGIRCEREEGHPCNDDGHHETKDRSIAIWTTDAADRWAASEAERLAAREPGPSSRCAVCDAPYRWHIAHEPGHPFAPKPRGRPRVAESGTPAHYRATHERAPRKATAAPILDAAPAILPRAKQRKTPGPIVDVAAGRIERAGDAAPHPPERCHPPTCHADSIHEPARVREFALPLCEAHRAWVERAGGTLAAG